MRAYGKKLNKRNIFSLIILYILIILQYLPAYANYNYVTGKIKVINTSPNKPSRTEVLNFYRYEDKIRLNLNNKIYYLINIPQEKVCVINEGKKTITESNIKDFIRFIPPPIFIFQNIKLIENYIGKDNVKIHFINKGKSTKIKVVRFKFNNNNYEQYLTNNNDIADKLIISNPNYQILIEILEYKQVPDKNHLSKYFKIPDNFQRMDLIKLKAK
ncbi:MAG: hypothetical protein A2104_05115 [Candidatus Melainabacteria bacterium GWF2_32_7]|nr:MAG: hypothetical protein A2104_05115 [Candidatus Melainabacteria bacterium GWF2_32_7]